MYDIIASKRRLEAADQQEQAATQETIHLAAVQYYDLVLAQARVSVTRQATEEAGELLRIERLRLRTGNGLPADELPAEAALANARQDLVTALNAFYEVSVSLAVTLHLDATIMLIPQSGAMKQSQLVRDDLDITEMLATATRYRPDLEAVRKLLQAAKADKGATIWGELGPRFQASYSFAGLAAHTTGQDDALHTQQKAAGSAGFVLGASTYGQINKAIANRNVASLNVESRLDQIRAAVVSAHQACITAAKLIPPCSSAACLRQGGAAADPGEPQKWYRADSRCAAGRGRCRSGEISVRYGDRTLQPIRGELVGGSWPHRPGDVASGHRCESARTRLACGQ